MAADIQAPELVPGGAGSRRCPPRRGQRAEGPFKPHSPVAFSLTDSLSSIEPGSGQDGIPGSPLRTSIKIKRGGPQQPQAHQILSSLLDEGEGRRRSSRVK